MSKKMKKLLGVMICALCFLQQMSAQRITRQYDNVSFSAALKDLNAHQDKYVINFVYDELEDFKVTKNIKNKSVPDAIINLIGFYPIKMKQEDNIIIVECIQKTSNRMMGRIVDSHHQPVDFANVTLLNVKDSSFITGGVTNENGQFVIPCEVKKTIIKVTCVGYNTYRNIFSTGKIGTIALNEATLNLQKVVIKGNLPRYKSTSEGIQTNVEGTVLSKMGTAEDVLSHIPGIIKKGNSYEVFGKGTPVIYLNGKKLQDLSELDRLASSDIKNVELLTEPGAVYDANVNAVIKIKTIKKAGDGWGMAYRQVYSQAHQNGLQEQLDVSYHHSGLDLFGSLYYGLSHDRQEQRNSQKVTGSQLLDLEENLIIKTRSEDFKGTIGFSYAINENHSFGATYIATCPTYTRGGWNNEMNVFKDNVNIEHLLNTFTYIGGKRPTNDISTYYSGKIGKVNIDWNGEAYFRKTGNHQASLETETISQETQSINSQYTADSRLYASKLVVTIPVWKGKLQLGNEYTNTERTSLYEIEAVGDKLPSNSDDKIKESNVSAFVFYMMNFGKSKLDAGLRYEYVVSDYYNKNVYMPDQSKTYSNLFPHVALSFPVKNTAVNLSYNVKVRRPSYSILSGNVQYNNKYTYQGGNPLTQPAYIHSVAMNVSYHWLRFYTSWRYTKDGFYQCVEPYEKDPEITVYTFRNQPHYQSINSGITLSPKIGCWQPMLDLAFVKHYFSIGDVKYDKPFFFVTFNNAFQLPYGIVANVDMDYTTKGHSTTIEWAETGGLNLSLYKGFFNDKLSVNIQGRDLFATYRNSNLMRYGNREIDQWNYADTRKLILTIRYKLNTSRKNYKGTGAGQEQKNRM